jgi:peroxiredoxin
MRLTVSVFVILLALGVAALALPPVPRKSPEFTIIETSGKQTLLSRLKGKVVLIEFLWTNCPHCQRASRTITKLHQELGARGFQPFGIALNPNVTSPMVTDFVRRFEPSYPIGYSTPEAVDSYLGRSVMEHLLVPHMVVIDRKGMIRAQSAAKGDPNLEDENYLRTLLDGLLKDSASTLLPLGQKPPAARP